MEDVRDELLDIYAGQMRLAECSFGMMGRMLDTSYLKKRLFRLEEDELYIYGGGYLGIQFYRMAGSIVKILSIVDKRGCLMVPCPDIPVLKLSEFEKVYSGQKIVVASVRFYSEIRDELSAFVDLNSVIYLGELLEGDLW